MLDVQPAIAVDWEDMASFDDGGRAMLLLADVGDNGAVRPFVTLYLAVEPLTPPPFAGTLAVQRTLTLRFPDGARDVEGVAVDAQERMIYLLTKRESLPRLYRVPLDAPELLPITAEYVGAVESLPLPESGERAPDGTITEVSPTAFALSADGTHALIVTLENSYRYRRAPGQSWIEALSTTPEILLVPDYPQIEAGDFIGAGPAVLIGSEGLPARMFATGALLEEQADVR